MPRHGYIPLIYFLLIIGINCNFPITTNHIPTTTTETLNFGKSCSSSNDCPGKGEYCTSFKICLCLETFVDIDNKCHPKVFPGSGPCYHDAQCSNSFPGSFCSGDNVCLCPHGLILKGNSCIQATIPPLIQSDNSSPNNYKSIARASLFDKLSTYISKKRKQLFDEDTLIANTIPDIAPGEFCNTDSACSGYPLSYCEDTCKCREGTFNAGTTCITSNPVPLSIKGNCATNEVYSEEGGLCLSKQSPGQPCQYSEQCSITISGAFCLNRKCACPLGWVASADGKTCNFKDTQCQAKGFIWVEELGECKEVILPGSGTCSHSLQCSAAFGGAVCFQKVCKCPTLTPVPADGTCGITCTTGGESFSSIVGSCLPNVEPGNECVYTSQCHAPHPGTICSMGRCKCARSQVFTGTMCADVCPSGFRIGNFNVCQASCNANQIEHNGNCLDFAAPGQNCEVNAQCTSSSLCATWNDAGISGSRCTCPSNMKIDSGICVIIKAQPGASCLLGEMCTGGSYCTSGICACNTGTVQVNSQCITPISVGPGSSCLSNAVRCGNGSQCTSGTCQCNGESHLVNGRCVKQSFALPGESCAMGQECSRQSVCSHQTQRCECILATKIAIGRTCVDRLRSHPGFPCGGGEVCVGGSQCHKSTCKCPGNQIAIDKQCTEAKRLLPGSNCKEEDICTGGSECSNQGKCECRQNQVIVQSMCTRIILSKPTEKCDGPQYRCIQNSYCQDGETCVCLAGMKLYHGQCKAVSRKSPGLGCSEFDECTNHSYCSGGFCHCTAPRILKNGRCEFAVEVSAGNQCRADDICLGGSNCLGGRCLCNEKTEVVRGGVCVEKIYKTPGQMCSESEICDGNSYCGRSKICVCYKNFIVESGKCVKKSRSNPGESCANGERCDGSSYCFKDMCICPRNHIKRDFTCIPLQEVKIGESCSNGQSCLAGSKCSPISKICACPPGFVNRHDSCVPIEVNPGLPCQHGETCLGRSSCKGGICTCPPSLPQIIDFVCSGPGELKYKRRNYLVIASSTNHPQISRLKRQLTTPTQLNSPCSPSNPINPCPNNAACIQHYCQCTDAFVQAGSVCFSKGMVGNTIVSPGQVCARTDYCNGASSCGGNGVCNCNEGLVMQDSRCVSNSISPPSLSCTQFPEVCIGGSRCVEGACMCANGIALTNGVCPDRQILVKPGERCVGEEGGGIESVLYVCTGNSVCVTYCICPGGENIIEGVCLPKESIANPGESCEINLTQCSSNSQCIDKVCTCNGGYVNINNECVVSFLTTEWPCSNCHNLPNLGESCTINTGCGYGGVCLSPGICQCLPNSSIQNGYCVPNGGGTALPGQVCSNSVMCSGGSVCALNNICVCPFGSFPVNNECVRGQTTGRPGYTEINPGSRCGQPFTICVGGSLCRGDGGGGGICECDNGYTPINNICSLIATTSIPDNYRPLFPGESCGLAFTYCVGGSFCDLNVERCICPVGQTPSGMLCVNSFQTTTNPSTLSILPGQSCDALCELLGTCERYCGGNSLCVGGICTCPMNQQNVNGRCQPFTNYGPGVDLVNSEAPWTNQLRLPGQACNTYSTCIGGSTCVGESCQCPSGFVPTNDKKSCINLEYLNRISNKPNLSANDGDQKKAFRFSKRKATCTDNDQCQGGMVCSQGGTCTCPQSLTNYNGQCLDLFKNKLAYPGSKCIPDDNIDGQKLICTNGSECEEGFCLCPVGTLTALTGFCMPIPEVDTKLPLPGEICGERNNHSCVNNAHCNNGYCLCPYGTKNNGNGLCSHRNTLPETEILKVFTRNLIQSSCTQTSDCIFPGECIQHKCSCPLEMEVTSQKTCKNKIRHSRIGEFCDEVAGLFCTFESFCINHYCSCLNGFVPIRLDGHLECKSVNYTKSGD